MTSDISMLRRRYLLMATSALPVDIAFTLVFIVMTGAWSFAPRSLGAAIILLGGVNYLLARRLFAPIERYLKGEATFEDIQRRLTQLPILTAQRVGVLMLVLTVFRLTATYVFTDPGMTGVPQPTIAQVISLCIIFPVFFFTYTYFVISDYLAGLCTFIFHRFGRNLGLFFGSYNVTLMAVAISAYFITRSLLGPIRNLSQAMGKVAQGDLSERVPVTSNDEVGELTGQFNNMVEGLRERERFRETFGRYVDESVAATILKREGEGVLAGETREATVLFTDIAGFTTIAEHLAPDALVAALNEYLETVLEPIRAHGGVVNTFIGDGLFASFNMPLACESHACAAVRAAIEIQRAVGGRTFGDMAASFATRIGISTGHVIGGSVGAGRRLTFTLLGDTVNLAARLEQLNKDYGTRLLVSNSTSEACGDQFVFRDLGSVAVRGRSDAAIVFSVDPHGQG